jgi:phosphate transport system permease protein
MTNADMPSPARAAPWIGGGVLVALAAALVGRMWAATLLEFTWSRPALFTAMAAGAVLGASAIGYTVGRLISGRKVGAASAHHEASGNLPAWAAGAGVLTAWIGLLTAILVRPVWDGVPPDLWLWLKPYGLLLAPAAAWCFTIPALVPHILRGGASFRVRSVKELLIHIGLFACALVSVLTTGGIIAVLAGESIAFFREVSPIDFLTGTRWTPQLEPRSFGILPLLGGTLMVAGGGLLIAVPVGLGAAIFLSEYAPPWLRSILKPVLEVLAGIPTVVYGFFALAFVTPYVLKPLFPEIHQTNGLSAIIVVGIMIIPTISSLCDDALRAVPRSLRDAAYALSATRMEVSLRVVLPGAASGVVAAVLLALARAIGETMAVALAAGMTPTLTLNPLVSIQTMTGYIVQASSGDTPAGSLEFRTIFAVGLTLFAITLGVNLVATRVLKRFREAYE